MIHTVGVTQMKYCYRMNINSVHTIYSICFPFEISKTVKKCLARSRILLFLLEAGTLPKLVFSDSVMLLFQLLSNRIIAPF